MNNDYILIKYQHFREGQPVTKYYCKDLTNNEKSNHPNLEFLKTKEILTIVSFDFDSLLKDLRVTPKMSFVDIEQLAKQMIGKPKSEFKKK